MYQFIDSYNETRNNKDRKDKRNNRRLCFTTPILIYCISLNPASDNYLENSPIKTSQNLIKTQNLKNKTHIFSSRISGHYTFV